MMNSIKEVILTPSEKNGENEMALQPYVWKEEPIWDYYYYYY